MDQANSVVCCKRKYVCGSYTPLKVPTYLVYLYTLIFHPSRLLNVVSRRGTVAARSCVRPWPGAPQASMTDDAEDKDNSTVFRISTLYAFHAMGVNGEHMHSSHIRNSPNPSWA